ncbi:MAG: dTDP-4-dehydrorhamnose 3,5-epimerase [Crocinitomicaceae bacterium]
MEITTFDIEGLVAFESDIFEDDRGYFFESYNKERFRSFLGDTEFVQDNQSLSKKHVLRGLHFQRPPYAQGKLVRVIKGAVLDVAVDIRLHSPTYGQHISLILSAANRMNFWIPEGFAHGFIALEEDTVFSYKCTALYHSKSEDSLIWNDKSLEIDWGIEHPIISEKDTMAQTFHEFKTPF